MAVNNVIRMLNLTRGLNTDGDVDADSLADNFVSNTYVNDVFVSNNFFQNSSTYRSGEIIEVLTGPCVGQNITVESGTYTMPNVTATLLGTSSYQDITGSAITYTPPTGTTRVQYQYDFLIGIAANNERLLNHYKLFIGGTEVTKYRHNESRGQYAADGLQTIKWTFEIGTANADIGSQATWTTGKEIKAQFREFSASYDIKLHETYYWDGTGSNQIHTPTLTITAIA